MSVSWLIRTIEITGCVLLCCPDTAYAAMLPQLEPSHFLLPWLACGVVGLVLVFKGEITFLQYLAAMGAGILGIFYLSGRISFVVTVAIAVVAVLGYFALAVALNWRDGSSNRHWTNSVSIPPPPSIMKSGRVSATDATHSQAGWIHRELWHGTPTLENARNIANGGGTWVVGEGNAYGTGVYLADKATAGTFAESGGALVRIMLSVPVSQMVGYHQVKNSKEFRAWAKRNGNGNHGDNITAYVTEVLGCRFVRVDDSLFVALAPRTGWTKRIMFEGIKVTGVFNLNGNQII